jgi:hypothetical protein
MPLLPPLPSPTPAKRAAAAAAAAQEEEKDERTLAQLMELFEQATAPLYAASATATPGANNTKPLSPSPPAPNTRSTSRMQPTPVSAAPSAVLLASPPPRSTGGKKKVSVVRRKVELAGSDCDAKGVGGGVGERALAGQLFPPPPARPVRARGCGSSVSLPAVPRSASSSSSSSSSSLESAAAAAPTPKPAAAQAKKTTKRKYLSMDKGRHIFRLLMQAWPNGDWSKPPSEELKARIAAEAGCEPKHVSLTLFPSSST